MAGRQSHWLNKRNMARSAGVSDSAFAKWDVEAVAQIGRERFFTVGDVLVNRRRHIRETHGLCGGCGYRADQLPPGVKWIGFCEECGHPIDGNENSME